MKLAVLLVLVLALAACPSATLRPEFTPIGPQRGAIAVAPVVASAEKVEVYFASAPAGFSLRENEVKVEAGFQHEILGIIKLWPDQRGECRLSQESAVSLMRKVGYEIGANAVIYMQSDLPQAGIPAQCSRVLAVGNAGEGWAVIVRPVAQPAPVSATPAP